MCGHCFQCNDAPLPSENARVKQEEVDKISKLVAEIAENNKKIENYENEATERLKEVSKTIVRENIEAILAKRCHS